MVFAYMLCSLIIQLTCGSVVNSQNVKSFSKPYKHHSTHHLNIDSTTYKIDDVGGVSHVLDGIGGLSGGGATSRLLVNYQESYRSQILDYLFKPQFGASLHILKVEIGGDAQSTEGTEHSHMHTESEEDYTRGYEWWLMKEAKMRNPNIKLVGLPWGWPGWIGQGTANPYKNRTLTATYIAKWIKGAKEHHGLTIDYVGIWNERSYDVAYIKELRKVLNHNGFEHVVIIASDSSFGPISESILSDAELAKSVGVIGAHYPGTFAPASAQKSGKPLWASEDYSTFNDLIGGGCWARLINQNYVNGNMTATISWNLIASYYDNLPFKRCSLMTANEPWSGHYELTTPLWVTAHTTQFTQPGWTYLHTVGHLQQGGSYVSLTDGNGNLTIVIETMTHNQSICIRPPLPSFTVKEQDAIFALGGSFKGKISALNFWQTQLGPMSSDQQIFVHKGVVKVDAEGMVKVHLPADVVVTLSTIGSAKKGSYSPPPASSPFPLPYSENFNPNNFSEAFNFADQAGAFELFNNVSSSDDHQWTLRQVVTQRPVKWCDDPDMGVTYIGNYAWSNVNVTVDVKIEGSAGVFVALRFVESGTKCIRANQDTFERLAVYDLDLNNGLPQTKRSKQEVNKFMMMRVDQGGCQTRSAKGLFLWLDATGGWTVTTTLERQAVISQCRTGWQCWSDSEFTESGWNTLSLGINKAEKIFAYLNGKLVVERPVKSEDHIPGNGFVAIGTKDFGSAQFDNFKVTDLTR